jgi:hypothetical protein
MNINVDVRQDVRRTFTNCLAETVGQNEKPALEGQVQIEALLRKIDSPPG